MVHVLHSPYSGPHRRPEILWTLPTLATFSCTENYIKIHDLRSYLCTEKLTIFWLINSHYKWSPVSINWKYWIWTWALARGLHWKSAPIWRFLQTGKNKNFAYAQVGGYFVNAIHAHFVCHLVQNLVNHTVAWINTKMSTYKWCNTTWHSCRVRTSNETRASYTLFSTVAFFFSSILFPWPVHILLFRIIFSTSTCWRSHMQKISIDINYLRILNWTILKYHTLLQRQR